MPACTAALPDVLAYGCIVNGFGYHVFVNICYGGSSSSSWISCLENLIFDGIVGSWKPGAG